ncbi:MAG: acetolactate synthase [Butyrivibrio sp.]|nr:acetolactate synthase [Butyrivibrio sp.]
MINQISVFLENKPGTLNNLTEILANNKIGIRALSLAETKDFGIARLIVDDAYEAITVLKDNDFVARLSPVIAFEIPDQIGGLNKLMTEFSAAKVNVEYMYASLGSKGTNNAYMIFRVAHTEDSEAALIGRGLKPLTQDDVANI